MAPIEMRINDFVIGYAGPEPVIVPISSRDIEIFYAGDDIREYGVKESGQLIASGETPTDMPVVIGISPRTIPPIEKGQEPTIMYDRLKLTYVQSVPMP